MRVDRGVTLVPHTGPSNARLTLHLGLVVPPGFHIRVGEDTDTATATATGIETSPSPGTDTLARIQSHTEVGKGGTRTWAEGEALLFDDSFEHTVWSSPSSSSSPPCSEQEQGQEQEQREGRRQEEGQRQQQGQRQGQRCDCRDPHRASSASSRFVLLVHVHHPAVGKPQLLGLGPWVYQG